MKINIKIISIAIAFVIFITSLGLIGIILASNNFSMTLEKNGIFPHASFAVLDDTTVIENDYAWHDIESITTFTNHSGQDIELTLDRQDKDGSVNTGYGYISNTAAPVTVKGTDFIFNPLPKDDTYYLYNGQVFYYPNRIQISLSKADFKNTKLKQGQSKKIIIKDGDSYEI